MTDVLGEPPHIQGLAVVAGCSRIEGPGSEEV